VQFLTIAQARGPDLSKPPPLLASNRSTAGRLPVAIGLTFLLLVAWLLTHRYQGLSQDARIYAVQALARIHPALANDLYLQNTSQDRYTLFSPFYGAVISLLGLLNAALVLTVLFAAAFLAGAWNLAKSLLGTEEPWLAAGALILTVGAYGSSGVFHYSEDYLSARSAAEALIAIALAVQARGCRRTSVVVAALAMLIHPLMALPGLLLLMFLMVPLRTAAFMTVAGIALTLLLPPAASTVPWLRSIFPLMDAGWLVIVKERSQFLFLQLWSLRDWEVNLRPFASLALTAAVFADERIRKLCLAAALVGASGLLVALIAGSLGPVALLVQGQAWRWVWVTVFIAVILMLPTALRLYQQQKAGPLCAILLIASWTVSTGHAPILAFTALALYLIRRRLPDAAAGYLRFAAPALSLALIGWGAFAAGLQRPEIIAASRFELAIFFMLAWQGMRVSTMRWLAAGVSAALGAACVLLVPVAFAKTDTVGSPAEIADFADWQRAIPTIANVYVANGHDASSFAWFTLQRPSYLSLDQSAGVVFSRVTALEVQRRSRVLLPLMDEDWRLLSKNSASHDAGSRRVPRHTPLTAQSLTRLCSDPQLNFLIAREDVGFDPVTHRQAGLYLNWNLYDCRHVRSIEPASKS
jgi:hypothetical protein